MVRNTVTISDKIITKDGFESVNKQFNKNNDLLLALQKELTKKVDKLPNKQLSTEDFTTALKNKLNSLSQNNINLVVNNILTSNSTLTYNGSISQTERANTSGGIFTSTLPSAIGYSGYIINLNKISSDSNIWTIATSLAQTINGSLTIPIQRQHTSISLQSDGSNWIVI